MVHDDAFKVLRIWKARQATVRESIAAAERAVKAIQEKFEDRKEKLMDHIEEWRDDGELDPIVAAAALAFVDDLEK